MLDWHRAHGENVARTARHFGFSRPTVYRWLERFDRHPPREPRGPRLRARFAGAVRPGRSPSSRPSAGCGRPTRAGARTSSSSCSDGRGSGCRSRWSAGSWPACGPRASCASRARRRVSVRRRTWRRPHAVRKPADWPIERPGDLVELDTLDIRPLPAKIWKQFTARDVVSRWDVVELRRNATARTRPASSTPSQRGCRSRSAPSASTTAPSSWPSSRPPARPAASRLFVLPPRRPKLHGTVERANRTHTEEFYEVTDRRARARGLPGRAPGLGDRLQHRPSPPGPGLPDAGRVPGLAGDRCVTEVPDEYTRLTLQGRAATIPPRCPAPG